MALGFTLTTAPHSLLLFSGEGPIAARYDQVTAPDVGLPGEMWHWELTNAQLKEQLPAALLKEVGVHGTCPSDCWVTLACTAQIDHDPTLDVWSVSTRERRFGETRIPAGELFNDVDDVWH